MVAKSFLPNHKNLPIINHKDEVKTNNIVSNLEWCTVQYNNNYGSRIQKIISKTKNGKLSKPILQISKKNEIIKVWKSISEAGRNGYLTSEISNCCRGIKKTHYNCFWKYAKK